MPKFRVFAGMVDKATDRGIIESPSEVHALQEAYVLALKTYEDEVKSAKILPSWEDCLTEAEGIILEKNYDDLDEFVTDLEMEADSIYQDYIDSWTEYYVEEVV